MPRCFSVLVVVASLGFALPALAAPPNPGALPMASSPTSLLQLRQVEPPRANASDDPAAEEAPKGWVPAAGRGFGGYWQANERRPPEPPSPRVPFWVGSGLAGVGLARGALSLWPLVAAARGQCPSSGCAGQQTVGWLNLGMGAGMLVAASVYWAVAAHRAAQRRRWDRRWRGGGS